MIFQYQTNRDGNWKAVAVESQLAFCAYRGALTPGINVGLRLPEVDFNVLLSPDEAERLCEQLRAGIRSAREKILHGAYCADCALPYTSPRWIEASVPRRYWHLISPAAPEHPDGGLLCLWCMQERFRQHGFGESRPPVPCRLYYGYDEVMKQVIDGTFNSLTPEGESARREWNDLSLPIP